MYTNSAAIFRGDIAGVVEQAKDYEAGLIGTQAMPILDVPVRAGQYPSFVLKEGQLLKSDVKNRAAYAPTLAARVRLTTTRIKLLNTDMRKV